MTIPTPESIPESIPEPVPEPMPGPDLDLLGREIGDPDHAVAAAVRSWLGQVGSEETMGRLAELASWWAGVRGHAQAPPPQHPALALDHVGTLDVPTGLAWGVTRAETLVADGCDLALLAVDDEPAARLASADLLGLDAVEANGWPAEQGQDDEEWMDAVLELRDGMRRTAGLRGDLTALLTAVGSGPLAAATAFAVRSAALRLPVLLDGAGALAAGLLARRTAYSANQWWQVAHAGTDALATAALRSLQLDPLLRLGLRVQDGTGARLAVPVLTEAAALLQ